MVPIMAWLGRSWCRSRRWRGVAGEELLVVILLERPRSAHRRQTIRDSLRPYAAKIQDLQIINELSRCDCMCRAWVVQLALVLDIEHWPRIPMIMSLLSNDDSS